METDIAALMIPIIFLLVTGLVLALMIYYNFRSKQLLIQKAGSLEEYKQIMESKAGKDSKGLLKTGIIFVFFGIGVGLGVMMEEQFHMEYMTPLLIFVFTGLGLVFAYKAGEAKKDTPQE